MSLSPVIGTEVPETANGVVTPIPFENGPHVPVSVKCEGSRVPCPGEASEDGALGHLENHVDVENRVHDHEGYLETKMYNNERTSNMSSSHTSHVTEPSLPAATCTGGSESSSKDTDIHEALEPPGAALLQDSAQQAHSKDSSEQGGFATTYRQPMAAETVDGGTDSREEEEEEEEDEEEDEDDDDGEKEKQDEEEDEKNEKKWIHQRAGGRAEVEVSGL